MLLLVMKERLTLTQDSKSFNDVFKPTWELGKFRNLYDARSFAISNGWRANPQRVQLRFHRGLYYVEPYEPDCGCKNIIKPF